MDWLISFILSVAASVVAYYICKWMVSMDILISFCLLIVYRISGGIASISGKPGFILKNPTLPSIFQLHLIKIDIPYFPWYS